jgi:hypothetical protein
VTILPSLAVVAGAFLVLLVAPRTSWQGRFAIRYVTLSYILTVVVLVVSSASDRARETVYEAEALALLILAASAVPARLRARRCWSEAATRATLVLTSPFEKPWKVVAGGPDPRRNHHQVVSDQRYAYDFLPIEGKAWDCTILAPCGGTIATVVDCFDDAAPSQAHRDLKNPAGNYISIDSGDGYVILAHLHRGSIVVAPGDSVRAGDEIGRCGNSGNTSQSHLHLHAQDMPTIAVNRASGIPVKFLVDGAPCVLDAGDILEPC